MNTLLSDPKFFFVLILFFFLLDKKKKMENEFVVKEKGQNGLEKYVIHSPSKRSTADVYLFGSHLTSYKIDGKELIFLSSTSQFDGMKAIRGGIPLCFPQFGPGKLQQHGEEKKT